MQRVGLANVKFTGIATAPAAATLLLILLLLLLLVLLLLLLYTNILLRRLLLLSMPRRTTAITIATATTVTPVTTMTSSFPGAVPVGRLHNLRAWGLRPFQALSLKKSPRDTRNLTPSLPLYLAFPFL